MVMFNLLKLLEKRSCGLLKKLFGDVPFQKGSTPVRQITDTREGTMLPQLSASFIRRVNRPQPRGALRPGDCGTIRLTKVRAALRFGSGGVSNPYFIPSPF